MVNPGLSVSRLIRVNVNLEPIAAQFRNFNALLILGASDVIDVLERMRSYSTLDQVAADFGLEAEETKAANRFFAQMPQPTFLQIGRWAKAATPGINRGEALSAAEQAMANWTAITNGGFKVTIDGNAMPQDITGLNFGALNNLNAVAAAIGDALSGASCEWDGSHFIIKSASSGPTSSVSFATAPSTGTDISAMLQLDAGHAASLIAGIDAESPASCVAFFDNQFRRQWYGVMFADPDVSDQQYLDVAAYIEGTRHIFGVTTADPRAIDSTSDSDLASLLKAAQYMRSFCQYSSTIAYAVASFFGRAFTVDFRANNSAITMMYKREPGIVAEYLSESQAETLEKKRCNVFVWYDNDTAIIEDGVMSGPAFFDEIHGTDWLADQIQTDVYNLLYLSPTKIPQTDYGNHLLVTTIDRACAAAVNNGLIGAGLTWESAGFGSLKQGDLLPKGYYIYAPPINSQAPADRAARKSVPIQVAAKLAGAIHTVDVLVNVNR